jgi:hypothetical protein
VLVNGLLSDYFRDISGAATNEYRPEDAYVGNLIGALRAIDAGITTITDLSQVSNTPAHSDALVKGLKASMTQGFGRSTPIRAAPVPPRNGPMTSSGCKSSISPRPTNSSPSRSVPGSTRTSGSPPANTGCAYTPMWSEPIEESGRTR